MSQLVEKIDKIINAVDSVLPHSNVMAQLPDATSSWVKVDKDSHFPIQNIPFGVFQNGQGEKHIGTAIGEYVLDLYEVSNAGLFKNSQYLKKGDCFLKPVLNDFMGLGRPAWREARDIIQNLLSSDTETIRDNENLRNLCLLKQSNVLMQLPCDIGDYTDFYSSRYHATNVGIMFRGKDNALQPNWLHLPVGYHGRASSVIVSGESVRRPCGQTRPNENEPPVYGPCKLLDFELEMAFFYGGNGNKMGNPIRIQDCYDHIFGLALMNDWSARDIQKWEYVPLGPFNAKNFATSISPWIVTVDALEEFKCEMWKQDDPKPLDYLVDKNDYLFDVNLKVYLQTNKQNEAQLISESNSKYLYWSCHQQLAHHTSTGCPFRAGDLLGSGTISGPEPNSYGSMLELSWKGTKPIEMSDGSQRKFIADGDKVVIVGECVNKDKGYTVGFGKCESVILPAHDPNMLGKL